MVRKARLLPGDVRETSPGFLYHIMEERNGIIRLGWQTRDWNETTRPISEVEIVEVESASVYFLPNERSEDADQ